MDLAWEGPTGGCAARETELQYGEQGTCLVLFPQHAEGWMKPARGKCPLKLCGVKAEGEVDAPTDVQVSTKGNPKGPRIWGEEQHMEKIRSVGVHLGKPTLTSPPWSLGVSAQCGAGAVIGGRCWASSEEGQGMGRTQRQAARTLCRAPASWDALSSRQRGFPRSYPDPGQVTFHPGKGAVILVNPARCVF